MFTLAQVLLVCIYMWIMAYVGWSMQLFAYGVSVLHGAVIGLIMGDVATGLTIGGTMTLMSLGIGGYGGSSVPDYALGTAAGTVFAIATGQGLEVGLAIGIPVATLGTQFDVLAKMSGSFFIHKQMDCVEKHQFKQMGLWVQGWQIFRATLYTLTIFLAMTVGSGLITTLLNAIPEKLMNGFSTAAGLLPAVGFAILLKYMPLKKYGVFLIFGFVMTSYLGVPMVGISLLTLIFAVLIYRDLEEKAALQAATVCGGNGDNEDE